MTVSETFDKSSRSSNFFRTVKLQADECACGSRGNTKLRSPNDRLAGNGDGVSGSVSMPTTSGLLMPNIVGTGMPVTSGIV